MPGRFDAGGFAERLERVRLRIDAASTDPGSVRIVAVTKGFGVDAVGAALGAGMTDIGENYADELVAKAGALEGGGPDEGGPDEGAQEDESGLEGPGHSPPGCPRPVWHFLGAVQRNKLARLAPLVTWWQSVSRVAEGRSIARRRAGATVLEQVDAAGIPGRGGCPPDEVPGLVGILREEDLHVAGLMAVGPPGPPEASRPGFTEVSLLADALQLPVRSMGMSDDLEVALVEGSTMVRLGRALFGERSPPHGRGWGPPGPGGAPP